jgi:hypothetical protein
VREASVSSNRGDFGSSTRFTRATEAMSSQPRARSISKALAHADAGGADRVRPHQVGAEQPEHPRHAPDAEDEEGHAHRRPPVHDEVDDRDLDRGQHDEDHEHREHGLVGAESDRARAGSPADAR